MKGGWPSGIKQVKIWILLLPLSSSEASGKSLSCLGLSFYILKGRESYTPYRVTVRLIHAKHRGQNSRPQQSPGKWQYSDSPQSDALGPQMAAECSLMHCNTFLQYILHVQSQCVEITFVKTSWKDVGKSSWKQVPQGRKSEGSSFPVLPRAPKLVTLDPLCFTLLQLAALTVEPAVPMVKDV